MISGKNPPLDMSAAGWWGSRVSASRAAGPPGSRWTWPDSTTHSSRESGGYLVCAPRLAPLMMMMMSLMLMLARCASFCSFPSFLSCCLVRTPKRQMWRLLVEGIQHVVSPSHSLLEHQDLIVVCPVKKEGDTGEGSGFTVKTSVWRESGRGLQAGPTNLIT